MTAEPNLTPSGAEAPTTAEAFKAWSAAADRLRRAKEKLREIEEAETAAARELIRANGGGNGMLIVGDAVVYVGAYNGHPLITVRQARAAA